MKSIRKEINILQPIKEFLSFTWLTQPLPVMVKSCAAALAMVLILSAAYLYVQQSAPLSAQLDVTGMSSVITRGRESERIIKEGDVLYSQDQCRVRFELNRDAFAYVFYYDSGGELHQLYPDPAAVMPQKVEGGKTYHVPEKKDACFMLDDQKGTETIFMVASARPIENISELYQATKDLNRDEALRTFREAAPVCKVLNFVHQ